MNTYNYDNFIYYSINYSLILLNNKSLHKQYVLHNVQISCNCCFIFTKIWIHIDIIYCIKNMITTL